MVSCLFSLFWEAMGAQVYNLKLVVEVKDKMKISYVLAHIFWCVSWCSVKVSLIFVRRNERESTIYHRNGTGQRKDSPAALISTPLAVKLKYFAFILWPISKCRILLLKKYFNKKFKKCIFNFS